MKHQHDHTEQNIRSIYEREKAQLEKVPFTHRIAHKVADFSGTVLFAGIHVALFSLWILLNVTVWKFDPYPFTLLTMAVSLESIFLSTFVLLSQNEMAKQADARNNLDLQVNLLAEQESTAMINLLVKIAEKMDIHGTEVDVAKAFADDLTPEDLLQKIDAVQSEDTVAKKP